jgi:hypothetical protein
MTDLSDEVADGVPGATVFIATSTEGLVQVSVHHFGGSPIDLCEQAGTGGARLQPEHRQERTSE